MFRFVLILLHIKSASKNIWHLTYICISINTKWKIFFSFNQWCLFIKWKVEARTTLFMQNYLFNFVRQSKLWMICIFLFWQKNKLFFTIHCRYSKANNVSQIVPWPIQVYRRTYSHFPNGPRHRLWHYCKKLFIIPYWQQTFFSFLQKTLFRWRLNLSQFSFVNESMFNLFVSTKPNIQKFILLIEKVTFQEKQYKTWIFFNKVGFNRSLLKINQYA